MNLESIIVSLLGGGVVVAILNWIHINKTKAIERRISFLNEQIQKLYGPLYYFVRQSMKLFELNNRWSDAYHKEFTEKKWSQDSATQDAVAKQADTIIDIRNDYLKEVIKNNERIKDVLNSNYSHIDKDDIDIFTLFYEHDIRFKIEQEGEGRLKHLLIPYWEVGDISFLRPEFIKGVETKFMQKKKELEELVKETKLNLKTKKIIAREGLIILAIAIFSLFPYFLSQFPKDVIAQETIFSWFWFILLVPYPIYLIVRFIIWAVKTLRKKE